MTRKLHPTTIIPPDLYVERSADRQLANIIDVMGRPGYVLVARQMGKTNLLLNARRTLAKDDLLFIYVDLSARFGNLSEYYKLILSTAAEVRPDAFGNGLLPLKDSYDPADFQAALRALLGAFRGRIVIILDEIDSLANYPFSDQIFSQIRSMYFAARTNHPEFHRLTFILSGVAEPSDLIKNKNVSPFNIGEKIYLSDFTIAEHSAFLAKADIRLPEDVAQRLYTWTGGNPRMTWDLCSEIEMTIERGEEVSTATIDQIVNEIYLTSFDRPPVDHVRAIVQADREIRTAVREILRDNTDEVSDETRTRLYLAGIVSMQVGRQSATKPRIKNKVLEEALSEKWLADVEKKSRSLLQQAREYVDEERYEAALQFYDEYLAQSDIEPGSIDAHRAALTFFHTARYSKAVEWFERYLATADSQEIIGQVSFTLARSYLLLGDVTKAVEKLRTAASIKSPVSLQANASLAAVLLGIDGEKYANEAEIVCKSVLAELGTAADQESVAARANALRTMGGIQLHRNDRPAAIGYLEEAVAVGAPAYQPYLLVQLIGLVSDAERKKALVDQLLPSIIKLIKLPSSLQVDGGIAQIAYQCLVMLRLERRAEEFTALLGEYEKAVKATALERYKIYPKLSETALEMVPKERVGYDFLRELIAEYATVPAAQKEVLDGLKTLIVLGQDTSYVRTYLEKRAANTNIAFDDLDFFAAGYAGFQTGPRGVFQDQQQLTSLINSLLQDKSFRGNLSYCWLCYIEIDRELRLGDLEKANNAAREVLELVERLPKGSQVQSPIHAQMKQRATEHLNAQKKQHRVVNQFKHLKRNSRVDVRYADGRIVSEKFKIVERDLVLGNCELIEAGEIIRTRPAG